MNDDLTLILTLLERHFVLVALILVGSLIVRHRAAAVQHRYWLMGFVWVALLPFLVLRGPVYTTGQIRVDDSHRFLLPATSSPHAAAPAQIVAGPSEARSTASASAAQSAPPALSPTSPRWDPTMLWGIAIRIYALGVLFGFARIAASLLALRRLTRSNIGATIPSNADGPKGHLIWSPGEVEDVTSNGLKGRPSFSGLERPFRPRAWRALFPGPSTRASYRSTLRAEPTYGMKGEAVSGPKAGAEPAYGLPAEADDRLRNSSEPTLAALRAAAGATGLKRVPRLIVNPSAPVPLTFWLGQHAIVIPSEDVSQAVLLHECAHIKRGDWFAQLISRLVSAAFWFDPILGMIERKMRALSETAADDCVVSAGIEPTGYAEELYSIAAGFTARRLEGGLAIVGNGDLKARIGELLRPGPRVTRVRFRWMAAAGLAGAGLAIACAALHYQSGSILAADRGLVVLPDGSWVRVIGMSGTVNGRQEAWDLDGNLFPSIPDTLDVNGVAPWPKGTCLLFTTSFPDLIGFELAGVGAPGAKKDPKSDSFGIVPHYTNGNTVWCAPIDLPKGAQTGVTIKVPGASAWKTIATAEYDRGRLTSQTTPGLFPTELSVPRDIVVPPPAGTTGTLELRLMDYRHDLPPREAMATTSDVDPGQPLRMTYFDDTSFRRRTTGDREEPVTHRELVLRARAASIPVYFAGIPTHPLSDRVFRAVPPEGIVYHDAQDGRYRFSDGEELALQSVSDWKGTAVKSWSGVSGDAIKDPDVSQTWHMGGRPGEIGRMFHFRFMPPANGDYGNVAMQAVSLFDAAGSLTGQGGDTIVTRRSRDEYHRAFVEPGAKPQDYVLRIADPTRASVRTLPIGQVYPVWSTRPSKKVWDKGEVRTTEVSADRRPQVTENINTTVDDVSWYLVDRQGRRITSTTFQTDGKHDVYTIPQTSDTKFTAVQIVTMPYLYIRFPNVWVNPK